MARSLAAYISEELQAEIKIGGFNIDFFLTFIIEDISVKDNNFNNLLKAEKLNLNIENIDFKNKFLEINKVSFIRSEFNLIKYKNDTVPNIKFITDYFISREKSPDSLIPENQKWAINCVGIILKDSKFSYSDRNKKRKKSGIDFNNINISGINLNLSEIDFYEETLHCRINNISLEDKSGFVLQKFKGGLKISERSLSVKHLKLITPNSELSLNFEFLYDEFNDFKDFINNVRIETTIGHSKLDLYDLGYFAPVLLEMQNKITLSGKIAGTINNFKANNFKFSFGNSTDFVGDISMRGLPDSKNTYVDFKIDDLNASLSDIEKFAIPGKDKFIKLPKLFVTLGNIDVSGTYNGFIDNFKTNAKISTSIGNISTDMALSSKNDSIGYLGNITATKFDIGQFLNIPDYFGKMNLKAEFDGSGLTAESAAVELNGSIDSLDFRGNNYNKIGIIGLLANEKFSGLLEIEDDNIDMIFDGTVDFDKEAPVFNFYSEIKNADLYNLRLFDRNPEMMLSSSLKINFTGAQLDEIKGSISIDDTKYSEDGKEYFMNNLTLTALKDSSFGKTVKIKSDFVDLKMEGDFLYKDIHPLFNEFISDYLAALNLTSDKKEELYAPQKVDFNIELKDTKPLTEIFYPNINISQNTVFSGSFGSENEIFELRGSSSLLIYNGLKFRDWSLYGTSLNNSLLIKTASKRIILREPTEKDTLGLEIQNVVFSTNIKNDSVRFNFSWDDEFSEDRNIGNLDGFLAFNNMTNIESKISNANIKINNSFWDINRENHLLIDTSSITFKKFEIIGDNDQRFCLEGTISKNPIDSLVLKLEDWALSNFDPVIMNSKIDLDGVINGNFSLFDLYGSPYFFMDMKIKDLYFNEEKLGDALMKTNWDIDSESIYSNIEVINIGNVGSSKILSVVGNYYPTSDSIDFEYDISLSNFQIRALTPFVSGFISELKGITSGDLKLYSINKKPNITGSMQLMRSEAKIDYINVSYSFADEVIFNENEIAFEDIVLYDSVGNKAVANGKISHNNLNDFFVDIEISPDMLSCLNTTSFQNQLFYGKASASGNLEIKGPFHNIVMNIAATTEKGTKVYIPISYDVDVSENDYIVFVNTADTTKARQVYNVDMRGFELNLEIAATPDAEVELYLPFQLGRISGEGNGDLKLSLTPQGDFLMNGDYAISNGTFLFTLQNLIKRQFEIMEGSEISWTGSPYDANINLKALYKVKTTIDGLGIEIDSTSGSRKRINVDCILQLKNQLFDPDIHFSIDLPNVDDETREAVFSVLDTTNEVQMNQQMISLLVLGSFSYSTSSSASIGASSVNLLSNQLSNWLSQISQDFDIGIHYRQGDQVTEEELEVALSTQLFNDRVLIDGNFGVVGNEKTSSTSNIVGDVNVEVKLTEDGRFRVKAFNRSNVNSIYDVNAFDDRSPYTQGVGVFYRKEFDTFGELFGGKKNKKKRK